MGNWNLFQSGIVIDVHIKLTCEGIISKGGIIASLRYCLKSGAVKFTKSMAQKRGKLYKLYKICINCQCGVEAICCVHVSDKQPGPLYEKNKIIFSS